MLDIFNDPEAGKDEDKLRLIIIAILCDPNMTDVSIATCIILLNNNCIHTPLIQVTNLTKLYQYTNSSHQYIHTA